jgi:hypothetical protein
MPEPNKKPMKEFAGRTTPKGAAKPAQKPAPKSKPVPQDDGEQCETNDANPSSGPRKPKCHEGYPEQQPTDKDAGE